MRRVDFKVPIYDWKITVVTLYGPSDADDYRNVLNSIAADKDAAEETISLLEKGCTDGGDYWYDKGLRIGTIGLFPWTSDAKFWETINHEKRHLVDRILEHAGVNDFEAAAYLDGYVSTEIFGHLKELTT